MGLDAEFGKRNLSWGQCEYKKLNKLTVVAAAPPWPQPACRHGGCLP